jgi:hypothetical protein
LESGRDGENWIALTRVFFRIERKIGRLRKEHKIQ